MMELSTLPLNRPPSELQAKFVFFAAGFPGICFFNDGLHRLPSQCERLTTTKPVEFVSMDRRVKIRRLPNFLLGSLSPRASGAFTLLSLASRPIAALPSPQTAILLAAVGAWLASKRAHKHTQAHLFRAINIKFTKASFLVWLSSALRGGWCQQGCDNKVKFLKEFWSSKSGDVLPFLSFLRPDNIAGEESWDGAAEAMPTTTWTTYSEAAISERQRQIL